MFRIVTTEPEAVLFVLCDNPHCSRSAGTKVPKGVSEQQMVMGFFAHLQQREGWQMRPYGHYCKLHHDQVQFPQSNILVASDVKDPMDFVRDPRKAAERLVHG